MFLLIRPYFHFMCVCVWDAGLSCAFNSAVIICYSIFVLLTFFYWSCSFFMESYVDVCLSPHIDSIFQTWIYCWNLLTLRASHICQLHCTYKQKKTEITSIFTVDNIGVGHYAALTFFHSSTPFHFLCFSYIECWTANNARHTSDHSVR